ncbi:hypothetical protein L3X38_004981 [Prunus dulcis]|uniref:Uncharacterized protein n=1 Tax=Prunus dulcis TaxID=3755 RepID=A0AAD4ZPY1_PRUDU|nr:hypothetical protein L3X38_004981 [Prunus dulcis]
MVSEATWPFCPVRFFSEKPKPLPRREVREREALEIIVVFSNSQTWVLSSHLSSSVQRSSERFSICKFFHRFSSGLDVYNSNLYIAGPADIFTHILVFTSIFYTVKQLLKGLLMRTRVILQLH